MSTIGSVYMLTCTSTGSPATDILWTFNEKPISSTSSPQYIEGKSVANRHTSTYSNTLEISEEFEVIVGEYSCQVQNQLGLSNKFTREIKGVSTNFIAFNS